MVKYILANSFMFPNSIFSKHWKDFKDTLYKIIPDQTPLLQIEVPKKYNYQTFHKIESILQTYL